MKQLSIILFVLFPFLGEAQTVMDLQECLRIGLQNNYDLRIVRNEEQISDNNVTLGNAGFLPTLSANAGTSFRNNNIDQFPMDGDEKITTRNSNTHALDAGVDLNWTIFEGFRVQTNYQRLQELQTVGELNTQLAVENFIANLSAEYYNYIQHEIRLKNLKYAVELSRERLRIVEARYQIGSLSRLDLQQARVDFNADSSRLIQQQEVVYTSRINLNEMMGMENVENPIVTADSAIHFKTMPAKATLHNDILKLNKVLQLTEKSKTLSELDLKFLQSRNFPYLRLNAGYGFTHFNYNKGSFDKQRNWGPQVGLTLGYTIFDGFNRSREQRNAQIVIENRQLEIEKQTLALESDFASMWMAYHNNIQLAQLEKESLENARINYEIAMERYRLGDLSGLELREAQNSLLEAEDRLITAQYRTKLYEISLLQISGNVAEYLQ